MGVVLEGDWRGPSSGKLQRLASLTSSPWQESSSWPVFACWLLALLTVRAWRHPCCCSPLVAASGQPDSGSADRFLPVRF